MLFLQFLLFILMNNFNTSQCLHINYIWYYVIESYYWESMEVGSSKLINSSQNTFSVENYIVHG